MRQAHRLRRLRRTRLVLSPLVALVVLACCGCAQPPGHGPDLPGTGEDAGKTVIYRDTWGVPHIYAPTVAAGLYAQGWAQAEDRPEQLLRNLMMGLGEYASVVGEEGVQVDLRSHLWDHYGVAKRQWEELRPEVREHLEAFAKGIDDYYAAHPGDVPEWWRGRRVDPHMIVAFSRLFVYNWSIDEVYGDLRRGGIEPGFRPDLRGSNQFAVAPSRSAEGAAILAIDPHLAWDGPARFWEFRVHAGELHGSGVMLAGTPYIGNGHTRTLAWAMTTGGPDTADVYELALDPADPGRYRYDGEWRALTSRQVTIAVRGAATAEHPEGTVESQQHTLSFSHHGPILAWKDGKAYAGKTAYADLALVPNAMAELNLGADGYRAAMRAMDTLALFPQNVMVADTSGHIYYQRTGRVPRRPDGYDWSVPVDGSTSATEWQGLHPASDHLQVLDPPQGWMQNCNIPPDAMMPGSPFQPRTAGDYLFGSLEYGPRSGWTNQRGARAVELLQSDDSVTAQEAMAYITDLEPAGAARWIEALRAADVRAGAEQAAHPHYRAAFDALAAWDRRLAADSRAALVYDYWRLQLLEDLGEAKLDELRAGIDDLFAIATGRTPAPPSVSAENERALVAALARAMERLIANHGDHAVYGDRYRVGRGERSWPVAGGGGHQRLGTTTLRNMGYSTERDDKTRWGQRGQTSTQVIVLSDPPRSWLYLPWGQSDRPESPHYSDQAEKLFSTGQLKPSWWLPEDLAGHIESRTVLEGAPAASQTSSATYPSGPRGG
jgi:acyl-homoserine-lactone acylase